MVATSTAPTFATATGCFILGSATRLPAATARISSRQWPRWLGPVYYSPEITFGGKCSELAAFSTLAPPAEDRGDAVSSQQLFRRLLPRVFVGAKGEDDLFHLR